MHTIRLAGPWTVVRGDGPPRKVRMPAAWEAVFASPGTAKFTRRFNRPPGLDDDARVWLSVAEYRGTIQVRLDGVLLTEPAADEPVRVRLEELSPFPRLDITLTVAGGEPPQGLYGPVVLEIEGASEADTS